MNYIRRSQEGIEVNNEFGSIYMKSSLKKYINNLCIKNLSTYDGRRISTGEYLGKCSNTPIYVDDNIFLYPIKSIRQHDTVFVNFHNVLSIKTVDNRYTKFIFTNLSEITLNVSINKIKKQHSNIIKVIHYLNNIY